MTETAKLTGSPIAWARMDGGWVENRGWRLKVKGQFPRNPNESYQIQLNPGGGSAPANNTKPPGPLCCHPVASLLPVLLPLKRLPDNDVTDVATFGTAISDAGLTRV